MFTVWTWKFFLFFSLFPLPPLLHWQEKLGMGRRDQWFGSKEDVNSSSMCTAWGWNQPEMWGSTLPSSAHQTQHVAAHTWWCSYTEEGYGSTEPCCCFRGAGVALWIPRAGFQDWRETCWHS